MPEETTAENRAGEDRNLPLDGMLVIDMVSGTLAAIGRRLADLGADVLRVEPPGGAADRRDGPLFDGVSLSFIAANAGKSAVTLDPADAVDRERFEALLDRADILIENTRPGSAEAAALDVAGIHRRKPALVILSASDFGQEGEYSRWQATAPVIHALSGELARSGKPGRAPLLPPSELPYECAASQAVFAILVAFLNRLKTGWGDHLDFALLDGASQALDPGFGVAGSATAGASASAQPRGRPDAGHQYPILPCADGYVRLCILSVRQWRGMFEWLGRPAELSDPALDDMRTRFASPQVTAAIARLVIDKSRAELEEAGQRHGVPVAGVLELAEAIESDQVRARNLFVPVPADSGMTVPLPDGLMEIDGRRVGVRGPAPALGTGWPPALPSADRPWNGLQDAGTPEPGERPLARIRVLDLGVIVVGAEAGRLLADQGAEVIKVENSAFPDGMRESIRKVKMTPSFMAGHRNKKSLGIDLRHPEGRALLLKMVEKTDIVLSNFKPGTLESLGLGHDVLSAVNPRLIMVDSSAFGSTGPWSRRMGYGPLVRAAAGLTTQWRYPDDPQSFSDAVTVYPDHVVGRVCAIGALALLIRRLRSGRGGTVGVAQSEVMLNHMAVKIAAASLARSGHAPDAAPERDAPWGVFPCAGEDEWCVVTVRGDGDWQALCRVLRRPDLAGDPALATAAQRDARRDRVDQALVAWLRQRSPQDAMGELQTAGVPAGAMLRVAELPDFGHFKDRGFFHRMTHSLIAGAFHVENAPVRSKRLPDPKKKPAPLFGEDTVEIAQDLLGLSPRQIDDLVEKGILETGDTRHAKGAGAALAGSA
ncbi:CaiB/BaiF CoA transferase family protein [Azospirillum sp. CT11-132]|uniref:CaiB/BaiF CoA transferase family protein n=1 Tax=Azospirillum sp. CT11-132 TaxID=3396317 RepID=UPI0039A4ECA5